MRKCIALFQHGWADWESGCILAALRQHFDFEVQVATPRGAEVKSIGGVRAVPDIGFAAADPSHYALVLVIGSSAWLDGEDATVTNLLLRANASGALIGAICAGTVALAQTGLLNRCPHTSNEKGFLEKYAPAYSGEAHYRDSYQAVASDNVVTASGMAPISFAVAIMRLLAPDHDAEITAYERLLRREHAAVT